MRKEIYLGVVEALKQITDSYGTQVIQHFDLWNQNVDFAEEEIFATPAVFIEFNPINYKPTKDNKQFATVGLKLHIVTEANSQTQDAAHTQEQALEFFDLLREINAVMYMASGICFGDFARISSLTNHNHGNLMESIEIYDCHAVSIRS